MTPFLVGAFVVVMLCWGLAALPRASANGGASTNRVPWVKIAIGLVSAIVIGAGIYAGRQYLACSGLEDDYLNSVSQLKTATVSQGIVQDEAGRSTLANLREANMRAAASTLAALNSQCGSQAADTAVRKGSGMLQP
ncbi:MULTISPECIES: hypothetical protein [unclassified Novosphingobium]|uniref:hypothetical protein n=1 Tax=unclassified Novosphingobium TaxID=2644732 RepID=UPI000D2FB14C|nr:MULTISPECIES: hypothetical protein [unclassified Novosphingobium]PTR11805.1 hypothetical protein C8K11_104164 [Novosphingobium sp. GV055]PUB04845.1 hypothetical protein C8K12_104164 [Novosphingobium sp. GV061]PUB21164.1 hypothetical protein C8K14_104164 [Novosphingobium sp. GV079]PUB42890.1 hypothetical protein C8K10_104164 [Novosphingobium sp. GV027]